MVFLWWEGAGEQVGQWTKASHRYPETRVSGMGDEAPPRPTEPQQQHNKVSKRESFKDADGTDQWKWMVVGIKHRGTESNILKNADTDIPLVMTQEIL